MKKLLLSKVIALSLLICSANLFTNAQAPNIQWQKSAGGNDWDGNPFGIITQLKDGNYLRVGSTFSIDGDFASTPHRGGADAFVIKFKPNGTIIWIKTYGGSAEDNFNGVVENPDKTLTIAGGTFSNDFDVSGNHGDQDVWVVKLSQNGTLLSQHCFGGTGDDYATDIVSTNGNKYALTGWSTSNDGDINNNHGGQDAWVGKINQNFSLVWSKSLGGSVDEIGVEIISTTSNKLIISGFTGSNDGDMQNYHGGDWDAYAMELDASGNISWSKCYGGSDADFSGFHSGVAKDGNLLIAGSTYSTDGNITDNHGGGDFWIVKINNANGNVIWSKCFGTAQYEYAYGILTMPNGDLVALGLKGPNDGIFGDESSDAEAIRMDKNGNKIWDKTFGGSNYDEIEAGVPTNDGGMLLLGLTFSNDGGVTNQGDKDLWLVKLDGSGCGNNNKEASQAMTNSNDNASLVSYPNPFSIATTVSFFISQSENISVKIFDVNGRLVSILADKIFEEGINEIVWNAADEKAEIYFLQFQSAEKLQTEKLIVTK